MRGNKTGENGVKRRVFKPHIEMKRGDPVTLSVEKTGISVLGIDPGISGAFVVTNGANQLVSWNMPLDIVGKEKAIAFEAVQDILTDVKNYFGSVHIFLERAVPMAMGSKGAFTYGRGFEALVIAIRLSELPVTLVEPARWTKEMHEGISQDLKPKVRSLQAVQRLYPQLVGQLPKKPKGGLLDGPVDALLIAGYGLRRLGGGKPVQAVLNVPDEPGNFY